jgi:hypothetical protein
MVSRSWIAVLATAVIVFGIIVWIDSYPPPIPAILAINLEERTDRWTEVQQEFRDWSIPIERIPAVRGTPGWVGCSLSHRRCIRTAKERQYPWVLIVEDDCVLKPDAQKRFLELLPYLWSSRASWDIFNGGVTYIMKNHVIDGDRGILQVRAYAAHFYLVHSGSYDRLLDGYNEETPEKIDVYYEQKFRIWTVVPFLATQRVSVSDIEHNVTNYTDAFKLAEKTLTDTVQNRV